MKILAFYTHITLAACLPYSPGFAGDAPRTELIMFDQAYCEWCERWEEEIGVVYAKTTEGKAAPLRRIDIRETRPEALKGIKGVAFTPTFVLIHDGKEVGRIAGYHHQPAPASLRLRYRQHPNFQPADRLVS